MSSPNHSKDPGKSHSDKNESNNKEEKQHGAASHGSPNKWKNTGPSSNTMPPTHAGPSRAHQTGGLMKKFNRFIGKEEHISQPPASVLPGGLAKNGTPDQFGGAGAEDILVGNGVLPNGGGTMIRHLNNDSGSDNYSDHESGSGSSGGGSHDSGRNSNQSPSESCALQLHISALPENVLENIFSFLDLADIRNAALVCHEWNRVVGDENSEVWRTQCFRRMSREVVYSELLTSCPSFKAKLRAHLHAWNPLDCSRNIYVKPNGFTIHRNPVAQSTDGARGKIGFNRGRHAWEIVWEGPLGTVAVVGVATQQAEVRAQGYIALLGKDDQSWGWNLVENLLLHNGDSQGNYPVINNAPRYQVGERIRVILDCEDNTLSFEKNFEFLGVAFRGLPNREKLFPAVSAVYGNTEISMVYLGPPLDG